MTAKWSAVRRTKVPPEAESGAVESRRALRDALALSELRMSKGMTQVQLAERMRINQASVSAMEHRSDVYLSSLREYVEALGGRLEVDAIFGDERVRLTIGGAGKGR